jgi:hypothetical protein
MLREKWHTVWRLIKSSSCSLPCSPVYIGSNQLAPPGDRSNRSACLAAAHASAVPCTPCMPGRLLINHIDRWPGVDTRPPTRASKAHQVGTAGERQASRQVAFLGLACARGALRRSRPAHLWRVSCFLSLSFAFLLVCLDELQN